MLIGGISRLLSIPNSCFPVPAMSFFCYKHLAFFFLLIDLVFSNQLVEAQTLIDPNNFDQTLLPFGSQAMNTGSFISDCSRHGTTFTVLNNCPYTVWAAVVPGGGRRLDSGEAWTLDMPYGTSGRIWGRTNCSFDHSGRGKCETGDCGGVLQCQSFGAPPNTLAEFALNQLINLDFLNVSLVDGFNIPIKFSPTSNEVGRGISCAADINGQCPIVLRAAGGCNNPCTVFQTDQYCCSDSPTSCEPTSFSKFFKDRCPNAYSYLKDNTTGPFIYPGGTTNYDVVFCPSGSSSIYE